MEYGKLEPNEEPTENVQKQTATDFNVWLMTVKWGLRVDSVVFPGNTLPQQLFSNAISD